MDADRRPEVRGVVLAGGESRRFGDGSKALATLDGDPLIARVARAVREATGAPPTVAVRGPAGRRTLSTVLPDATFVEDAPGFEGPLAGVAGAARATTAPWLFVCGCDMPLLSAPAVEWLADHADG
jgi:molybdopterin-guanine dinucleotide biosynthesis protein A